MRQYMLELKKETEGAYILIIPETGNEVMLPKSQCSIYVQTADEILCKGRLYTLDVEDWIADKKKLDEGGEVPKVSTPTVTLLKEKDNAIRVEYTNGGTTYDMWFPKSTVQNTEFPDEGEDFKLKVPEWLLKKKMEEESKPPSTGRKVVSGVKGAKKVKSSANNSVQQTDDLVGDDVPF